MYYNSNQNSNDYYNAYKREIAELEAYKKEEKIQGIIKLILTFLTLILFCISAFYLYKYFNPTLKEQSSLLQNKEFMKKEMPLPMIVIREEELPQSIQLQESEMQTIEYIQRNATDSQYQQRVTPSMSEREISLIVKIILSQMNTTQEIPLEEALLLVENKKFETKTLENENHYNKVILLDNEEKEASNSTLMQLTNEINSIVEEGIGETSSYSKAIQKEVRFRENEMRIIIVQEGDTLSRIAKKAYGNYNAYPKIFSANPEIIKNPNQIFVGQRLRIPV